jgi:hypothetical protein
MMIGTMGNAAATSKRRRTRSSWIATPDARPIELSDPSIGERFGRPGRLPAEPGQGH